MAYQSVNSPPNLTYMRSSGEKLVHHDVLVEMASLKQIPLIEPAVYSSVTGVKPCMYYVLLTHYVQ